MVLSALAQETTFFAWLYLAEQIPFKDIQAALGGSGSGHSDCWVVASLLLVIDVRVWT